jgi:hypothetical protein
VGTEAHPVGVADPHARGHDVVDHARELVDPEDLDGAAGAHRRTGQLEAVDGAGALGGPDDIDEHPEETVEVDRVGRDQAVREQVQAQEGICGVRGWVVEVELGRDELATHPPHVVLADQCLELSWGVGPDRALTEDRLRVPGVEDGAVLVDGRQSVPPGAALAAHGAQAYETGVSA